VNYKENNLLFPLRFTFPAFVAERAQKHEQLSLIRQKLFLYQAVEVNWVVRHRGFHVFYKIGSEMTVRLSAF
jgi:hypothetical protein